MESAADKQKRLIQQEIAKLSGKLARTRLNRRLQKLINQAPSPDMDIPAHHARHPTQQLGVIHTHQEELLQEVEDVGGEEEGDTHWI
jgi:hypothetical protein